MGYKPRPLTIVEGGFLFVLKMESLVFTTYKILNLNFVNKKIIFLLKVRDLTNIILLKLKIVYNYQWFVLYIIYLFFNYLYKNF